MRPLLASSGRFDAATLRPNCHWLSRPREARPVPQADPSPTLGRRDAAPVLRRRGAAAGAHTGRPRPHGRRDREDSQRPGPRATRATPQTEPLDEERLEHLVDVPDTRRGRTRGPRAFFASPAGDPPGTVPFRRTRPAAADPGRIRCQLTSACRCIVISVSVPQSALESGFCLVWRRTTPWDPHTFQVPVTTAAVEAAPYVPPEPCPKHPFSKVVRYGMATSFLLAVRLQPEVQNEDW